MMHRLRSAFGLCVVFVLVAACSGPAATDAPGEGEGEFPSHVAFQLSERDLIPEGICYDPADDAFYLGSIRKSKILKISRNGAVAEFVPRVGQEVRGFLGMKVDPQRKVLWANWHQGKSSEGFDPQARHLTGISTYDLNDGRLIRDYAIEKTGDNHLFNDVAIARDGTVFLTSFAYGMIYRIDPATDRLVEYLKPPGDVWTNGIDITPDDRFLFVVGNSDVYRVDLESDEILQLSLPENQIVGYGDGLYFHRGSLIVIAGHREEDRRVSRVLELKLSEEMDRITEIRVLDQDHPLYSSPTTGAIVDDRFYYIATAQFGKFDENGNLAPWDELSDTYILELALE